MLNAALRAMAEEDGRLGASPGVEARLVAEMRAVAAARRMRTRRDLASLAAAAAFVIAIALPVQRMLTSVQTSDFRLQTSQREVVTDFMPLPYSVVPMETGQIVRLEFPRAALASFGLVPTDGAGSLDNVSEGTVMADVIVGDDGLARAVRFVRRSTSQPGSP